MYCIIFITYFRAIIIFIIRTLSYEYSNNENFVLLSFDNIFKKIHYNNMLYLLSMHTFKYRLYRCKLRRTFNLNKNYKSVRYTIKKIIINNHKILVHNNK